MSTASWSRSAIRSRTDPGPSRSPPRGWRRCSATRGSRCTPATNGTQQLVGKTVTHPFDGREIPIVADGAIDPEFGTGAVKVTPAHDPIDFEIAQRTGLPLINIFNADATVNENAAEEFYGLGRYDARIAVREALEKLDLIVEEIRPYVHTVGHCYRCHSEIEPWIAGLQWFVAVDALRGPAKEAALDGRITFWPERWQKAFVGWLDNLRDWNISRQLWWGHRIPAWYCPDGHVTVAREDPDACGDVRIADARAGPRRPGHVVLVAALAVLHAGLARRHRGPAVLLSEHGARDGLRDPLPLGGPDDHVGHLAHGRHPVPQRGDPRTGARRARPQDVQVARQRDRSDGDGRSLRRRRAALLPGALGERRTAGHPALGGVDRGCAQLREQDLERGAAGVPRLSAAGSRSCRRPSG